MTEIEIGAEIPGKGGAKFRAVSSFPKVVKPCETVVDKINGLREIKYVDHHTDENGITSIVQRKVRRKII